MKTMKNMQVIGLMALVIVLAAGCARQDSQVKLSPGGGMYSALDATAQVYSHPRAQAPVDDNAWRYLGFAMHPVGVVLDYAINRPLYTIASLFPGLFGYTSEDVLIQSQR